MKMFQEDQYTLLEGKFEASEEEEEVLGHEEEEEEEEKSQQGDVSVTVSSRTSSRSAEQTAGVTRDVYLRMCQFHTVPWFQKPIARQVYHNDGTVKRLWYMRSTTTYDLMLDMLFVCLFTQISKAFFGTVGLVDGDFHKAFIAFAAMSIPVFTQWYETLSYLNRFDAEDVVHLVYFFYNVSAIGFLGLHLMDCSSLHYSSSCSGVVLSLGALRFGVAFMEFYASFYNSETRIFLCSKATRNLLISSLWILLALLLPWNCDENDSEAESLRNWKCTPWENNVTAPLWWGILIFELALKTCMDGIFSKAFDKSRTVPLDLDLFVERMGMMITVAIAMTVVMCT